MVDWIGGPNGNLLPIHPFRSFPGRLRVNDKTHIYGLGAMNRHASMNRAYRLIWSVVRQVWIPVAEKTRGRGKQAGRTLIAAAMSLGAAVAQAGGPAGGPSGGQVTAGSGSVTQSGAVTTITQDSPRLSLTWTSFNIAPQQTVDFLQPSSSAIAVNRILDTNGTQILGHLNANGQVFLINPNGILFGPGAEVNVGGLVASTLDLNDASLDTNARSFAGTSIASVVNDGTINAAAGGYVALLGSHVSNQGAISAQLGTVALGAGSAATLTFSNNSLLHLQVDQSVWRSVAANGGLIRADGGQVIMSAGARDALLASVVNNTGVIEARTVGIHDGEITLLAGMTAGTVDVGGTLDASAPSGGNGGFIETSAAHVEVATSARVTTAAAMGLYGSWLIDPQDYTIAASGGDITGATLSSELASTPILIESSAGLTAGSGNINVNDAVAWSANTVLTLTASNNVNINANIAATGNTAGLIINPNTANGLDAASGSGIYTLLGGASITLSGATPSLSIAGHAYTVINALGALGSTTGTDLQGISGRLGGYYALGSNIDATPTLGWNGGAGFMPIGAFVAPFSGTFDGLGHTISHLTINQSGSQYVGVFGDVVSSGVVRNVGMLGGSVVGGPFAVGALVGRNYGAVSGSFATGNVTGSSSSVGGLVGTNDGTISNSHASGNVSTPDDAGGLVGANYGSISNSYATGAVSGANGVGGLVGSSRGNGNDVYATGAVTGTANIGGLVGINHGTFSNSYATGSAHGSGASIAGLVGNNVGTVNDSYATGAVTGGSGVGGLVGNGGGTVTGSYWNKTTSGRATSDGGTGLTTTQMQTASNFTGFNFTTTPGAAGNNWVMVDTDGGLNNEGSFAGATFPMLASEYSTIVTNAHQLQLMAMNLAANYTLGQNIDASATALAVTSGSSDIWSTSAGFVPIGGNILSLSGSFNGSFDGQGHTISNLTINWTNANNVGLFGFVGSAGVIENVGLLGGSVSGGQISVGGLIGRNYGTVSNSSATGNVTGTLYSGGGLVGTNNGSISDSHASGDVSTPDNAGGLVGLNYGSITNSYATGAASGTSFVGGLVGYSFTGTISNSHATGNVSGSNYIGGLAGTNYAGVITGSYATGNVTGTEGVGGLLGSNRVATISNSYATGNVTGAGRWVGGLVGSNASGTIADSYTTGAVSGANYVGGLVGVNGGMISGSHATGAVTGSTEYVGGLVGYNQAGAISGSYAIGIVMGGSYVGGLVGYISGGAISNSYATGSVTGTGSTAGGLVGTNTVTIDSSYATGAVSGTTNVGGMVGANYGAIGNSYATGNVSGIGAVGGLVGLIPSGSIDASYATGAVIGTRNGVGGLVGDNSGAPISNSHASGPVTGGNYVGGLIGSNTTGIISNSHASGLVTGGNYVGGLIGNNTSGIVSNSYAAGNVIGSERVGGLVGQNYGNSSQNPTYGAISNSYATGSVTGTVLVGGLVGFNNSGAISNSYATGNVSAGGYTGGLVGTNFGTISTSYATGTVSGGAGNNIGGLVGRDGGAIDSSYATGAVSGGSYVGGLLGQAATQGVLPITDSYATGAVTGASNIGGLIGSNAFAVSNSYATGAVTGSSNVGGLVGSNYGTISTSYATGKVIGTAGQVGGLVGNNSNYDGTISDSFWNSDINVIGIGTGTITGAAGLSTAGMMTMSNFSGWSISDVGGSSSVWRIYQGSTAPLLLSFMTPLTVTSDNATQTYTGMPVANLSLTGVSYSVAGAASSGHIFNLNNAYNGVINVGSYAPTLYSDQQGYDISYINATLTLTPATLTVTANGATRIYGQSNPVLTGTISGFVGSDTLANATTGTEDFTAAATAGSNVGSYAISASGLTANNGNYLFSYAAGNAAAFHVTPATLTYNATAASFGSGQTPTGLSGTLSGFVLTDSQANATAGTLTWSTSASAGSAAGRYAIDGGGLTATNYVFDEGTANATALTVQAASSLVVPPAVVTPPVSGADATGQAQPAVGTLEADLPASRTNITLALLDLVPDIAQGQGSDAALAATSAVDSNDGIMMDKRVATDAMIPSLRIVHGGVKLPDNLVDVNAR
jgi:filamentous hemagglutinin family protein